MWSIFLFLHEHDALGEWYAEYTLRYDDDPTGLAALEVVFGTNIDSIEGAWRHWLATHVPVYEVEKGTVRTARRRESRLDQADASEASTACPPRSASDSGIAQRRRAAAEVYQRSRPNLLEQYDDAIPDLYRVIEMDPAHAPARYDLAIASILAGDLQGARRQREALSELDSNLASLLDSALNAIHVPQQ